MRLRTKAGCGVIIIIINEAGVVGACWASRSLALVFCLLFGGGASNSEKIYCLRHFGWTCRAKSFCLRREKRSGHVWELRELLRIG